MMIARGPFGHRRPTKAVNDNARSNATVFAAWTLAILAMWIAAVVIGSRI